MLALICLFRGARPIFVKVSLTCTLQAASFTILSSLYVLSSCSL